MRIITVSIFYFFCLMNVAGCKSKKTNFTLSSDISKYTTNSLDLSSIIGSGYKIISTVIKKKMLLIKAVKSDTSLFIGIDMLSGKELFNKSDPSNDYISSTFDITKDSIFSLSSLVPSEIFVTSISDGGTLMKIVDFERNIRPGRIILNQSQIFLVNDVWGIGVIRQRDFSKVVFHNEGVIGLVSPKSSTLSFPIDSSLNLLSGHVIANNTIQLYAIDRQDNIRWKYLIKQNTKREAVSILNFLNSFAVKYDSSLIGLNKEDGKKMWHVNLNNSISEIFKWHDKVLSYCLVNSKGVYPDNEEFEYKVQLNFFDCNTGKELWSMKTNSINIPHLGICNNRLLLSDNKTFRVFSLDDGKVIEKIPFSNKNKSNYAFEMLSDIMTGEHYLKSYDGKFYW